MKIFFLILYFGLYSKVSSKSCVTGSSANQIIDCIQYSTVDTHCCYLSNNDGLPNICYRIAKTAYSNQNTVVYNQAIYNIDCNVSEVPSELSQSNCGKENPKRQEDCWGSSLPSYSCCYYSIKGFTGCYWVGQKWYGIYNMGEFEMKCGDTFLQMSFYFRSVLWFILLLLFFETL